ncbi:MAG: type IX secretion system protein PorQ [Bacteroidota bacterium]|nr:type IX secretion system protein PorQ [Bacteroidota bacterium]
MREYKLLLSVLSAFLFISLSSYGQIGGNGTYEFLSRTNSARVAALGGDVLSIRDNDISIALTNPSLISPEMNKFLSLDYAGIRTAYNYGDLLYSRTFNKIGSFTGAFQFINYGKFTYADETGATSGDFTASEYALNVGWGRQLSPNFSIGANGKLIYSQLATYKSFGIAVDVAGTYSTKEDLFSASLIGRNIGLQVVSYTPGTRDPLPFELDLASSVKLRHLPLRISFLYDHIEKWDLSYDDPNDASNQKDPITGEVKKKTDVSKFADNLMRHVVIGGELTIAKVLSLRLGYNYGRRQELMLVDRAGLSGFSAGVGLRVKQFSFSYTHAAYQAGTFNPNYITVTADLGNLIRKK